MVWRQFAAAQQDVGGHGPFDQSPFPNLLGPPPARRIGQHPFSRVVRERNFPERRMADRQRGLRSLDGGGRGRAQAGGFAREPKEGAGIEEPIYNKSSSFIPASSSAASDAEVHLTGAEVVTPTFGRNVAGKARSGMSFATAVAPSRRRISSPSCT